MKPITVLSLFDGISCGQQALKELGIPVKAYYASEIHLPSIRVTQKNFPKTVQLGDIQRIKWLKHFPKIDLLLAGSPCQGFSNSGKGLNFSDHRSKLFFEFIRLLKETKPKNFLLENVKMRTDWQNTISKLIGYQAVEIDSRLVSAQSRKRLYWSNLPITIPADEKIFIRDILDEPFYRPKIKALAKDYYNFNGRCKINIDDKTFCLMVDSRAPKVPVTFKKYRPMTIQEVERCQTLPDNYTSVLASCYQRMACIGNGWTIKVIKHILKQLNN